MVQPGRRLKHAHMKALLNYQPKPLHHVRTTLLRSTDPRFVTRMLPRWQPFLELDHVPEPFPGDHWRIMQEPQLEGLARAIIDAFEHNR